MKMGRRTAALIAVLALSLMLVAGCGGGGDGASRLTPDERLTVASFNLDVANTVVDSSGYADLLDSIDDAIALAREKPDGVYETDSEKLTMRQVLADAASSLEPYRPEIASELDRAIATLP